MGLLNEARKDLGRKSKYPRKKAQLGPTVAGQAAYSHPADFVLPLSVRLAGNLLEDSDPETVAEYESGEGGPGSRGVWYRDVDDQGVRALYLYPVPSAALTLQLEYVFRGPAIGAADLTAEPSEFPEDFHEKLLYFCAAVYYRTVEDNPELAADNENQANVVVGELVRHGNLERSGTGIFRPQRAGGRR